MNEGQMQIQRLVQIERQTRRNARVLSSAEMWGRHSAPWSSVLEFTWPHRHALASGPRYGPARP